MEIKYTINNHTQIALIPKIIGIILGSILLGISAQIAVPLPFTPVPISLQSFCVALLAMYLGSWGAFLAVLTYLFQASLGLPVLAGGISCPFWVAKPTAGYLISFLVSSCTIGKLLEIIQPHSFFKSWGILILNETIILTLGTLWLGCIVGFDKAFYLGMLPFLPGALIKSSLATIIKRVWI